MKASIIVILNFSIIDLRTFSYSDKRRMISCCCKIWLGKTNIEEKMAATHEDKIINIQEPDSATLGSRSNNLFSFAALSWHKVTRQQAASQIPQVNKNIYLSKYLRAADSTKERGWITSRLPRGICKMTLVSAGTAHTRRAPLSICRTVSSFETVAESTFTTSGNSWNSKSQ